MRPSKRRPYRYAYHLAAAVDAISRFDALGIVEQDAADNVAVERQREADLAAFEAHDFIEPDVGQAGHERNAVGNRLDATHLLGSGCERCGADALFCVREPAVQICLTYPPMSSSLRIRSRSARQLLRTIMLGL